MPAPVIASLAKKAGVSTKSAETAWNKIKKSVVGAKLKSGATIPADQDKWTSDMWAYVTGALKNALRGMGEGLIERVMEGESPSTAVDRVTEYGKWYAREMDRLGHEIAMQSGEPCLCGACNESKG